MNNSLRRTFLRRLGIACLLLNLPVLAFSQNLSDSLDRAKEPVEIIVEPTHSDWLYETGQKVEFLVTVKRKNELLKNIKVDYQIGPEKMDPVIKSSATFPDGKGVIGSNGMRSPGFLRCVVNTQIDGKIYQGMATAGVDAKKINPTAVVPKDFLQFWTQAKEEAVKVPLDTKMELLSERSTAEVNVYAVSFQNNRANSRIYGILCIPKKAGKYPAYIRFPGAGIRSYSGNPALSAKGLITLDIGIHGIPVNLSAEVYNGLLSGALSGYPLFNLDSRDHYYFKRVIQGCLKSVDLIYSLPEFDAKSLAVMGSSQGGALSIITASLDSRVKYLIALCPALSDLTGYLHGRAGGWPHMFSKSNITIHGTPEKIETSAYFDVANFARFIKVPGFYSWGFNDETTPPTTLYAAFNSIAAEKHLFIIPQGQHKIYPEQVRRYTDWILQKLKLNN